MWVSYSLIRPGKKKKNKPSLGTNRSSACLTIFKYVWQVFFLHVKQLNAIRESPFISRCWENVFREGNWQNLCQAPYTERNQFNPAAAGPPRHPQAAGGEGDIVAFLYFCDNIIATRKDREAKPCTHLPEYRAKVVSKFGVDPVWNDVTVTSEVKL